MEPADVGKTTHQHTSLHSVMFPPFQLSSCSPHLARPCFPSLPTRIHTHAHINPEDESRRVAPLPALQQVAQTNWQQQNAPEKAFFSLWDLSALLTSNFIFIDHSLFSSIWSVAARRAFDILPCTIKVDNMPLWQKSKSTLWWIHPAFQRLILLWKVYICVVLRLSKEPMQHCRRVMWQDRDE